MENLEGVAISETGGDKSFEIDNASCEYLQELTCSKEEWDSMSEYEKDSRTADLIERSYELEKVHGFSYESIQKQIPSYQLEAMDKNSMESQVKCVNDIQYQRYRPDGKHQEYGYQRTITTQMNGGIQTREWGLVNECYLTDDIRKYFNCERISANMVAQVQEKLEGKTVTFHYDPRQEACVLTGGLEQYMIESHSSALESYKFTEAPQDFEQIQQISDAMSDIKELQQSNWEKLDVNQRVETLNVLERRIAEIAHRPDCPIYIENKGSITICDGEALGKLGGYNPESKDIAINSELVKSNNPVALYEILETVVHEGRHAYQDYNVNECEVHPRHSEVVSWSETMEGGKWGYSGGSSSLLGQRLYEQQSVEIDARNFASDVLAKFKENQTA